MLNLNDIQGNVIRAYGRYSFPFARYFFFNFPNVMAGRAFLDQVRLKVTTAARWPDKKSKPRCTTNIALTFPGMVALKLPTRTLQALPDDFIEGMRARAFILGDRDASKTEKEIGGNWNAHWDPIWRDNRNPDTPDRDADVHMLVTLNAQSSEIAGDQPHPMLEERTQWLLQAAKETKVKTLGGVGAEGKDIYQSASAIFTHVNGDVVPTAKEHFGYTDGIGDPVFEGQLTEEAMKKAVIGRGKFMDGKWQPLATGEFLLGHADESQELPRTAAPAQFMHNGTFMSYRKLHENVGTFEAVIHEEAARYAAVMGISPEEAGETIRAKMCGRWSDGVPLSRVPTHQEWVAFREKKGFNDPKDGHKKQAAYLRSTEPRDFTYADDLAGYKCPLGAHMRRVNTRDYLDPHNQNFLDQESDEKTDQPKQDKKKKQPNSALNKRRRILRRGLPYGPPNLDHRDDKVEQGIIMMVLCASLSRQFEFVQQQWIQYGLDFHQGNDTCPMLGNHDRHQRFTIPSDPGSRKPPYVMTKLRNFVECRGGDYFFIPSMMALRMMAMGIVDPT